MSNLRNFEDGPQRISSDDQLRSEYVRNLITRSSSSSSKTGSQSASKNLVQYWNDSEAIPADVAKCLESWSSVNEFGVERLLFDDRSARAFIAQHFSQRYLSAFDLCGHPAMRADYFRLCFLSQYGGLYVDADNEFIGANVLSLWESPELKVQPLCYRISSDSMTNPFNSAANPNEDLIFYVNNDPIFAPAAHPVVTAALDQATHRLLESDGASKDIQSLTGPGNLTETLVRHAISLERAGKPPDFRLLESWDAIGQSKWSLEYRNDNRNWRHWVCEGRTP